MNPTVTLTPERPRYPSRVIEPAGGGIFRKTVLHRCDFRMAELDRTNPEARSILRAAKRVALARHEGRTEGKTTKKLEKLLEGLDTSDLGVLAHIIMLWHPSTEAMATGKGGIWAMASSIVNEVAGRLLKTRPMFEIVD